VPIGGPSQHRVGRHAVGRETIGHGCEVARDLLGTASACCTLTDTSCIAVLCWPIAVEIEAAIPSMPCTVWEMPRITVSAAPVSSGSWQFVRGHRWSPLRSGRPGSSPRRRPCLPGKTLLLGDAAMQGPYCIRLNPAGSAVVLRGREPTELDAGFWRVQGDQFCRDWN
jgi:hypothetical protein